METDSPRTLPPGCVAAVYNKPDNPLWQGNPYIEALPDVTSLKKAGSPRPPSNRGVSGHRLNTSETQSSKIAPWAHWETRISEIVRRGYTTRNPLHKDSRSASRKLCATDLKAPNQTDPSVLLLDTDTRGKTAAVKRILASIAPPVIAHTHYDGEAFRCLQIPSIYLTVAQSISARNLLLAFFRRIDSLIATNYYTELTSHASLNKLVSEVELAIARHGVGLVVLDKACRISGTNLRKWPTLLKLIQHIGMATGMPFILVGCGGGLPWPILPQSRTAEG